MVGEIRQILSSGFDTYKRNFNIAVPFMLSLLVTVVFTIVTFVVGMAAIFGSSMSSLESAVTPEEMFNVLYLLISQNTTEIVFLGIITTLICIFIQSFFMAGAIGMARQATETGTSDLSTMIDEGKKNTVNLYLANILAGLLLTVGIIFLVSSALKGGISSILLSPDTGVALLLLIGVLSWVAYIAGIVFLVPGALKVDLISILSYPDTGATLLLLIGITLWVLLMLILSIVLSLYRYSIVVENLGPIDGIVEGVDFFKGHKHDVFLLWLLQIVILIIMSIIGQAVSLVPVMDTVWPLISMFISVAVIAPLTTIWWVRLYMSGTDKKIYFNELLLHPSDLEKPELD